MSGKELSVTVRTDDAVGCEEVGRMFHRLAERATVGDAVAVPMPPVEPNPMAMTIESVPAPTIPLAPTEHLPGGTVTTAPVIPTPPSPTAWQPGQPIVHGTVIHSAPTPPATGLDNAAAHFTQAYQPAGCVELDKNGLPWDPRINTSNKAKTQQNVWKRRPGLSDEEYNTVVAELKQTMAAPQPAVVPSVPFVEPAVAAPTMTAPPLPSATVAVVSDDDDPSWPAPGPQAVPAPPAPPASAVPQTIYVPPPTHDRQDPLPIAPTNFAELVEVCTRMQTAKKITMDEITAVCIQHGLPTFPAIMQRPDLIPTVFTALEGIWATRG